MFKVGDWVRMLRNGRILKWEEEDNNYPSRAEEVELWKPQPEEWCWFYDSYIDKVTFAKFSHTEPSIDGTKYFAAEYNSDILESFCQCEPFDGELPTFVKDN